MEQFCKMLDEQTTQLRRQAQELMAGSQTDDANLTKIQANLHEICAAIGRTVSRTQSPAAWETAYLNKLDQLAASWQAGLARAEAHHDQKEAAIQQIKLETLARIRTEFCRKEDLA